MPRTWTIAVAGAGPAGLAAALCLARSGHQVTLIERFETPKPLGSGLMLQPTGLAVLGQLGLAESIGNLGQPIDRLFGRVMPSERVILDVRYRHSHPAHRGLAVHRAALFQVLYDAVLAQGIPLVTGRELTGVVEQGDTVALQDSAGRPLGPFDLVVDALGSRSPLAGCYGPSRRQDLAYGALWASLPWPAGIFDDTALEQRYQKASVMIGVLPIGRRFRGDADQTAFFWSLRPADYAAWRSRGLTAWKDDVRRLWPATEPLLDAIVDPDQLTLARYSHHTLPWPVAVQAAGRVVAIGDAAHSASPQLGQGANMALLDARALAVALAETADLAAGLRRYAQLRRWHVRWFQALSALFTPFYQSDSAALPVLRDWLVAPATRLPLARNIVARSVAGVLPDPRRRLGLEP